MDSLPPAAGPDLPGLRPAPHRHLCTDCGVSRMENPKACARACQFIAPDYAAAEARAHGRARDPARPDELHFGPFRAMWRAQLKAPLPGAQWSGITTRLAERLLETGAVEAVLTVAPDPADRWRPVPVLVTRAEDLARCRGMRMGYAPLLALLEPARTAGHRRIAVIGIPCQVYALRALEAGLGFERIYVIGTPCSDNSPRKTSIGSWTFWTSARTRSPIWSSAPISASSCATGMAGGARFPSCSSPSRSFLRTSSP